MVHRTYRAEYDIHVLYAYIYTCTCGCYSISYIIYVHIIRSISCSIYYSKDLIKTLVNLIETFLKLITTC
jgi:hypothetical protein